MIFSIAYSIRVFGVQYTNVMFTVWNIYFLRMNLNISFSHFTDNFVNTLNGTNFLIIIKVGYKKRSIGIILNSIISVRGPGASFHNASVNNYILQLTFA